MEYSNIMIKRLLMVFIPFLCVLFFVYSLQRQLNVKGYQCSTDLKYVLFKHNIKHVSIKEF